jgi:diacylglycerol kinase family enzyme
MPLSRDVGILANPVSGTLPVREKEAIIGQVCEELGIHKVDLSSLYLPNRKAFLDYAAKMASEKEELIVFSGDGTLDDMLEFVTPNHLINYIPLGSGMMLSYALGISRRPLVAARQIKQGSVHKLDLIACEDDAGSKLTVTMGAVGVDAVVLKSMERYSNQLSHSLIPSNLAAISKPFYYAGVCLDEIPFYPGFNALVSFDGASPQTYGPIKSINASKTQYVGYGCKFFPKPISPNDGLIHTLISDHTETILGLVASLFPSGNIFGKDHQCSHMVVDLIDTQIPVSMHTGGNARQPSKHFEFKIIPGALNLKY